MNPFFWQRTWKISIQIRVSRGVKDARRSITRDINPFFPLDSPFFFLSLWQKVNPAKEIVSSVKNTLEFFLPTKMSRRSVCKNYFHFSRCKHRFSVYSSSFHFASFFFLCLPLSFYFSHFLVFPTKGVLSISTTRAGKM